MLTTAPVRLLELVLLFLVLPLAFTRWAPTRLLIPALIVGGVAAAAYMNLVPGTPPSSPPVDAATVALVAGGSLLASGGLLAFVALAMPRRLFDFPRAAPGFWAVVMVAYPLASALPQEIVWRWFFFHRYAEVFPSPVALSVASALFFGFAHIVMRNRLAVIITTVGGVLFSETYRLTGSLWLVTLEHAILGNALFTVGLGQYLYAGARGIGLPTPSPVEERADPGQ